MKLSTMQGVAAASFIAASATEFVVGGLQASSGAVDPATLSFLGASLLLAAGATYSYLAVKNRDDVVTSEQAGLFKGLKAVNRAAYRQKAALEQKP